MIEIPDDEEEQGESDRNNGDDLECLTWDIAQAVINLRGKLPKFYKIIPGHDKFTLAALRDHSNPLVIKSTSSVKGGKAKDKDKKIKSIVYYTGVCTYRVDSKLGEKELPVYECEEDIPPKVDKFWFCACSKACFNAAVNGSTKGEHIVCINTGVSNAAKHAKAHGEISDAAKSRKLVKQSFLFDLI